MGWFSDLGTFMGLTGKEGDAALHRPEFTTERTRDLYPDLPTKEQWYAMTPEERVQRSRKQAEIANEHVATYMRGEKNFETAAIGTAATVAGLATAGVAAPAIIGAAGVTTGTLAATGIGIGTDVATYYVFDKAATTVAEHTRPKSLDPASMSIPTSEEIAKGSEREPGIPEQVRKNREALLTAATNPHYPPQESKWGIGSIIGALVGALGFLINPVIGVALAGIGAYFGQSAMSAVTKLASTPDDPASRTTVIAISAPPESTQIEVPKGLPNQPRSNGVGV